MPWKDRCPVKQREEFVLRALEPGACMSTICREFGISRKTGYKWLARYRDRGLSGLEAMSRRPSRSPLKASAEAVVEVVRIRLEHPTWGPRKLRAVLLREGQLADVPSDRTICRILERVGMAERRSRRRRRSTGPSAAPAVEVAGPNDLWTVDFKGWWLTRGGQRCEPLTVRDAFSRYVFCIEVLPGTAAEPVRGVFERLFSAFGLPRAIQSDNGSPFASSASPAGLSRLSAWWTTLGIECVRGRPGCPQDNGGHERMHRDIAVEIAEFAAYDRQRQQEACTRWLHEFNHHRPHEALQMGVPADAYKPSRRRFTGLPVELVYPEHWEVRTVNTKGAIKWRNKTRFLSESLAGLQVGIERASLSTYRIWLAECLLGETDLEMTMKPS